MRRVFGSIWMKRAFRLSIVVGFAGAAWHTWVVWERYNVALSSSIKMEATYRCAARLSEETLKRYTNEMGNINVRRPCLTEADFYVAPYELEAVREGTMEFRSYHEPFDWPGAAIVGVLWAMATIFITFAVLSAIELARWVWGSQGN